MKRDNNKLRDRLLKREAIWTQSMHDRREVCFDRIDELKNASEKTHTSLAKD